MDVRLEQLFGLAAANDAVGVRRLLRDLVPEYEHERSPEDAPALAAPYPDGF
jgi:hypothetical protein